MRIVIADAHRVFAEALTSLLKMAGHEIVGCATELDAAAGIIKREQVDACVMDLRLPGASHRGAIARVVARAPRTAFVVLAEAADAESLPGVVSAGVRGVALKSDDFVEILRVLTGATSSRASSRGARGAVLSLAAQSGLGNRNRNRNRSRSRDERAQFLTQRERETLARLVQGESTTAIARSMGVRVSTARSHVDAVLTKLGAHSRLEAVAYAVRERLVDVDVPASVEDWESDGSRAVSD
jgi:two-component system, NarL family, nitrate/nitrite response regulator NarL